MFTNFAILFVLSILLLITPNLTKKTENQQHHNKDSAESTTWTYEETEEWGGKCQRGERQSPINIQNDWFIDHKIPKITFVNYGKNGNVTMSNNGHTVVVNGFDTWTEKPYITDGELGSNYMLSQFHFHWSQNEDGSEHTVEGQHAHAELHLVHIKEGLSFAEAIGLSNGLAVLGVFFQIGYGGHTLFPLQNGLSQVTKKDVSVQIEHYVPSEFLSTDLDAFFRYNGSLTTPNCNEAVIWTVYAVPLSISGEQIELLRAINGHDGKPISSNVRPVQKFSRKTQQQQKYGYGYK